MAMPRFCCTHELLTDRPRVQSPVSSVSAQAGHQLLHGQVLSAYSHSPAAQLWATERARSKCF